MGDCTISAVCRLNLSRKTDVINIRLCFWTNYPSQSGETESSSCQVFLLSYIIELFSRRRFLQFLLDEIILPEKLQLYPALIYMQTSPFYCANSHIDGILASRSIFISGDHYCLQLAFPSFYTIVLCISTRDGQSTKRQLSSRLGKVAWRLMMTCRGLKKLFVGIKAVVIQNRVTAKVICQDCVQGTCALKCLEGSRSVK